MNAGGAESLRSYAFVELWGFLVLHYNIANSHGVVRVVGPGYEIYVRDLFRGQGEEIIADLDPVRLVFGSLIVIVFLAGLIKVLYNRRR